MGCFDRSFDLFSLFGVMTFAGRKRSHWNAFGGGIVGGLIKRQAGMGISAALRRKFANSGTRTQTKRRGREVGYTTQFNDSHRLYQFRRAPRRIARRVRKFVRGVRRAISNDLAQQVMVRTFASNGTATSGSQTYLGLTPMYGCLGASSVGNNDVSEMFYSYGGHVNPSFDQKLITKSAVLDYKISARSANTSDMYVDAYYCSARRDIPTSLSNNVTGLFSQCLSNIGTPSSGTALTPTALGVTPFDCSDFCKLVKISKVRRYKIAAGDSVSIQIRDPREYVWSAAQYGAMAGGGTVNEAILARKGVTEWVLVIVYGAPASGTASAGVTFDVTQQRNYHYVAEEHTGLQGDYV